MRKTVDLSGKIYGALEVISMVNPIKIQAKATCKCQCGKVLEVFAYNLKNGNTKSCGCVRRKLAPCVLAAVIEAMNKGRRTHGRSKDRVYICWLDARKRCFSKVNQRYKEYGGRGITMCESWRLSFANFLKDMGECPPDMTLDRINVNGNYEPGNCRWIPRAEQMRNTRANVATWESVSEIRGLLRGGCLARDIAKEFGMSRSNVQMIGSGATWPESQRPSEAQNV